MMEGGASGGSSDDALLSRLYQQVTDTQGQQFAAGYDLEAGLSRYQAWLHEHGEVAATTLTPEATEAPDVLVALTILTPTPAEAPDTIVTITTLTPAPAEAPDTIITAPTLTPEAT